MEEEFSNMSHILKILVIQSNTDDQGTHSTTSQDAGDPLVSPARGS